MGGELEPFVRQGKREKKIEIEADEIMKAIVEGRDIEIDHAIIDGDLDIRTINFLFERDEDNRLIIRGSIKIISSEIRGNVDFSFAIFNGGVAFTSVICGSDAYFCRTTISGIASFSNSTFHGIVNFKNATFCGWHTAFNAISFNENADFSSATFNGIADFRNTTFIGDADFGDANFSEKADFGYVNFNVRAHFVKTTMEYPGGFQMVSFRENTTHAGLWNYILHPLFWPIVWLLTIGKVELPKWPVTDFSEFNTNIIMDGSTNPYLKRYIDDEQWIASWRERGWWRKVLFVLWEATSHCGRSIGLWAFWSAAIAVAFAFIYQGFGCDSIAFNVDKLNGVQPGFWGYLYYSIVTFTTLGFGDIVPLTNPARLAVGAEVVLGYIMLGGLISIFANKFARRS